LLSHDENVSYSEEKQSEESHIKDSFDIKEND